jgi:putative PIN family toxin of toxin-antitoxin system
MKAVFDTNVLISALITDGKPKTLFAKAVYQQIQLVTSKPILMEFTEIASDPRIRKYVQQKDVIAFL